MTSFCLWTPTLSSTAKTLTMPSVPSSSSPSSYSRAVASRLSCKYSLVLMPLFPPQQRNTMTFHKNKRRSQRQVVSMAPEEEKLTRRSPLDFPIEWEKPKPGRRPDIFPQFSPMKTPLPPPMPYDPPEEDEEEEEEEKKEEEEEGEEDPEKEESDNPQKL